MDLILQLRTNLRFSELASVSYLAIETWMIPFCVYADTGGPFADAMQTRVFGQDFPNPIGLAAGFDKHAEAMPGTCAADP